MKRLLFVIGILFLSGCSLQPKLGAVSDISSAKLQEKFNASTEIKQKYKLEGSVLKREVKADPRDRIEVKIGNEPIAGVLGGVADFSPDVTISRWDEVNFKLHPKAIDTVATKDKTLSFDKDKIIFSTPKADYKMYEMPVDANNPEGAFEYEVILKEKPKTNVVEFQIDTQGLDFFYQGELTKEEIDEGAVRPENVIGSYAVYASENKINYVGGKEYKTGKVGHIYRPKIIDATGKEFWGEFNKDLNTTKILSVTLPDGMVYPILVDPTFGYTAIGLSNTVGYTSTRARAARGTAGVGTVTQIDVYGWSSTGSVNVKLGLYASTTLVLISPQASPITISDATAAWRTASSLSISVSAQDYYVTFKGGNTTWGYYFDNGEGADGLLKNVDNYATWADPFNGILTATKVSIYATYTAAATYCGHTGGDWYISSNCFISANTTTNGFIYMTETGQLNCVEGAIISAKGIKGKRGTKINAKQSCKFNLNNNIN